MFIFAALLSRTHDGGDSPNNLQLPCVRFHVLHVVSVSLLSMHGCSYVYRRGKFSYCHMVANYRLLFLFQFISAYNVYPIDVVALTRISNIIVLVLVQG